MTPREIRIAAGVGLVVTLAIYALVQAVRHNHAHILALEDFIFRPPPPTSDTPENIRRN